MRFPNPPEENPNSFGRKSKPGRKEIQENPEGNPSVCLPRIATYQGLTPTPTTFSFGRLLALKQDAFERNRHRDPRVKPGRKRRGDPERPLRPSFDQIASRPRSPAAAWARFIRPACRSFLLRSLFLRSHEASEGLAPFGSRTVRAPSCPTGRPSGSWGKPRKPGSMDLGSHGAGEKTGQFDPTSGKNAFA
jgi:hypothetical protein